MKTGRVRKKAAPPPKPEPKKEAAQEKAPAKPPSTKPRSQGAGTTPRTKPKTPYVVLGIMGAIFLCLIIFFLIMTLRGGADQWVPVTQTDGTWTTTLTVYGPQVTVEERWELDCSNDPNATIKPGSCVLKDAETYQDRVVDDYEEYAYNIYYEETWDKVYQAQGTEFRTTSLGSDDWWEGNLHYTRVEELDKDSCEYTKYTIWVDDRQDSTQEVEVYLAECEVWDHIVVKERVYDQKSWCQCNVTALVQVGELSEQGRGLNVFWPNPNLPQGGRTEQSFKGQVTFRGDDLAYSSTTDDLDRYQDYMTSQYYIGLKDGKPVSISKNPKE